MELTEKQADTLNKRMNVAAKYRGLIIQQFSDIEMIMDVVICRYFCDSTKKANELLFRLVSDNLDFDMKQILVGFILINSYPKYNEENSKLMEKIRKVQKFRNMIAHRKIMTDTSNNMDSFNGDDVYFENFTAESNKIKLARTVVNNAIVNENINTMSECHNTLVDLLQLIIGENGDKQ